MNDYHKTKQQSLRSQVSQSKQQETLYPHELTEPTVPPEIKIMLVEDSEIDRSIYRRFLRQQQEYSYSLEEFDNAEDALKSCIQNIPDVILLDYYLPDINGLDFLQQITPLIEQNFISVIVITGQKNPKVAVELIKMKACDYLDKNEITAASLTQTINCCLKHSQTFKEKQYKHKFKKIISDTALKIHQCLSLEQILKTTVTSIREILCSDRVLVYQLTPDPMGVVIEESVINPQLSLLKQIIPLKDFPNNWLEFYRQGNTRSINDVKKQPNLNEHQKKILADLNIRSTIAAPILVEGKLWGLLMTHSCNQPRSWHAAEVELMKELAISMAIAIQQAILIAKLRAELEEKEKIEANLRQQVAMIDLAYEAIIAKDLNGRIIFWNQGAEKMYGWTKEEAKGQLNQSLLQTKYPIKKEIIINDLFTQNYWQGEVTHHTKEGKEIIVESRHALMRDSLGEPAYIIANNRDITERKQLEEKLKTSEERLRLALELTEIGSWDHNIATDETTWSDYLFRLQNIEPNSVVPKAALWQRLIHPEDLELTEKVLQQAIKEKIPIDCEYRIIKPNGEVRWVLEKAHIFYDEITGSPTRILGVTIDITQRKETEIAIQQQKLTLSLFFEYVPAGVAMLDLNMCYVMASKRWISDYNLPPLESIIGRSDYELFPELPPIWRQLVQYCLEGATLTCDEAFLSRLDGTHNWSRLEARPWYDHNQKIAGIIIFSEDINERKQSEKALKELNAELEQRIKESTQKLSQVNYSLQQELLEKERLQSELFEREQLLNGFFNAASDANIGTVIVDKNLRIVAINESLAKIDGYTVKTHLQNSLEELLPDLGALIMSLWQQVFFTKQSLVNVEVSGFVPSKPGVYRDWLVSYFPIILNNQEVSAVGGIIIEVTEQKKVEASLREFQRKWVHLVNNVQLIVVELNNKGYVESANPFFFQLTQYTESEVLGKHWFTDFMVSHPQNTTEANFLEFIEQDNFKQYNHFIRTKSGKERMISWTNTLIQTNEQIIGIISIGEDITERYQLAKMKDEFISVVSHELRTPLTAMQAGLSLINEKIIELNSPEGETTIQIVTEGTDRLAHLVNDILALSRLESGKIKMEKRIFPVTDLLNSALAQMHNLATQAKITINIDAPNLQVNADFDRILEVLLNLLSNAIRFSPENARVWLTAEKQNSQLLFQVIDTGRGIPSEQLSRIFESFYQVDSSDSRTKGGTGLGLTICQKIITQHGGKIWAESVLSEGSTFSFTIPD